MKLIYVSGALCGALISTGCASAPTPTDQLARTEAALRAAEVVGAKDVAQAELHHKLAQEQLDQARKLIQQDENERARSVLERSKADAELALALTRQEKAEEASKSAEAALEQAQRAASRPATEPQSTASK